MKKLSLKDIFKYIKNPKNKPVLFFGFYFFFFLFIAVLVRMSPVRDTRSNISTKEQQHYYNLKKLDDANYHFKYNYNIDGNITLYEGDRNGVRSVFAKNDLVTITNFYSSRNSYMQEVNGLFIKVDTPYLYEELFDVNVISEILDAATFISKTEFQDKKHSYRYQISTTTLEKIINSTTIDLDDIPNEIVITMDNNYYVEGIEYKLDSFINFKYPNFKTFDLKLEYSDFGNIKEIEEPKV